MEPHQGPELSAGPRQGCEGESWLPPRSPPAPGPAQGPPRAPSPRPPAAMFPAGPPTAIRRHPPSSAAIPTPPPLPGEARGLLRRDPTDMEAPRGRGEPGRRPHLALLGDLHRHLEPRRPAERREPFPEGGLYLPSAAPHWAAAITWAGGRGPMGNVVSPVR